MGGGTRTEKRCLDRFKAQLSPKRYWRGPRSQEAGFGVGVGGEGVGRGGGGAISGATSSTRIILH